MLSIKNHLLVGDQVSFRATPNVGAVMAPRYLVLHFTAGRSLETSVESLCTRKPQGNASAHLVLGRDGRIVQLAPFNMVTWHAGVSQWAGLTGMNQYAIGLEMDNAGMLHREGERFVSWFGKDYPSSEVRLAEHRHGGGVQPWHTFTEVQIARALELSELLAAHYGLHDVLGHEDIAPGRKTDPGPAFPLAAVRSRALGRTSDEPVRLRVTVAGLNIRSGPSASAAPVAAPLKLGTELLLLQAQDRWSHVAVVGPTDLEGWVSNALVAKVVATRGAPPARAAAARPRKALPVKATPKKSAQKSAPQKVSAVAKKPVPRKSRSGG